MKFVRYIYIRQHTLQIGTKKPTNYIVNFRYIYRKFPIYIYTTKYTLSWNKNRLQNMSEIFDMVHMNQVGYLAKVSRDFRNIISWAYTKVTASMSTIFFCCGSSGRHGIVDMLAVTFVFKISGFPPFVLLTRLCHESHVIPLLDFRLGSYEPYRKFPTYFVGVFCSNLECKLPIYIGNSRDIL